MSRFFISFSYILFISSGNLLYGQSEIRYLCFTVDSISWELNINNCATNDIDRYEIFTRETASDNFSVVFSGNEAATTGWKSDILKSHDALFIRYNLNCPAEMTVVSDTLSLSSLRSSVDITIMQIHRDGNIFISWEEKPLENVRYDVNSIVDGNSEVIATNLSNNSFTDTRNPGDTGPVFYSITAYKEGSCNYTFPEPDEGYSNTSYLSANLIECEGTVDFTFTPSAHWREAMESQTLFVVQGNTTIDSVELPPGTTSFEYANIAPGNIYDFVVEENNILTGYQHTRSNWITLNANYFDPVQWIVIREISFDQNNNLTIQWQTDPTDEEPAFNLHQGSSQSVTDPSEVGVLAENQLIYNIEQFDPSDNSFSLSIEDSCGNTVISEEKKALWVSAQLLGGYDLAMEWNPLVEDGELSINSYDVYLIENGSSSLLSSVNNFSGQFFHKFNENSPKDSVCVYVIARGLLDHPGFNSPVEVQYRSNTVCVYGESKIILPNAYAPDSGNSYLPIITPREGIVQFNMTIYDRYGNIVFRSDNPDRGWNGSTNNQSNTIDIYTAFVEVTNKTGEVFSKSQSIILLR